MKRNSALVRLYASRWAFDSLRFAARPWRRSRESILDEGLPKPMPIAIPVFGGANPADNQLGAEIARVIAADLERSGLFAPIDERAFIQQGLTADALPRFQDWRLINAQALVAGSVKPGAGGKYSVEFRLWDVFGGAEMFCQVLQHFTPDIWRRVAHIIADDIYKRITGEEGYFDTRIVYIAESGPKDNRQKRLAIMDQDGENHQFLTNGADLVLTPRFSPAAQDITYMSYYGNKPRVYLFSISTGQQEVLGDFPGMTFAPRYSPDGNSVIMSLAQSGNTDIYVMDVRTRRSKRLTDHPAIDTSPSYSPDGARIVFNSDRGGEQQLYVMNADGSGVARISKGAGPLCHPGVVAARRPDRLHPHLPGQLLYRRHAPGRIGRAHVVAGLAGRGSDLGPERARPCLLHPGPGRPYTAPFDRPDGAQ